MVKLLLRLAVLVLVAMAFVWLAERPGSVDIQWMGRQVHLTVFVGVIALTLVFIAAMFLAWLLRRIWRTPSYLRARGNERRKERAYHALSQGIIAAGAGDMHGAARHALVAGETLKNEPLVALLGAQAAQLRGDKDEVKRVFQSLAAREDTKLLGLRGLHAHARDHGDFAEARKHAEAAHAKNSKLPWAATAVLQSSVAQRDWESAARLVSTQAKAGHVTKTEAAKRRAVFLTAAALDLEGNAPGKALALAEEAHGLDTSLVPATCVVARRHIADGAARKALKALRATWAVAPHRDLAALVGDLHDDDAETAYERVRDLVGHEPDSVEGRIGLARAALDAGRHEAAKEILHPIDDAHFASSPCGMMAEIESAGGDAVAAQSWLARAMTAPRDPMWVSDGVAGPRWVPVSPVSGEIVPCEWKVPFAHAGEMPRLSAPAAKADRSLAKPAATLPRPPDDPGVE